MTDPTTERVAGRLLDGVRHLRAGQLAEAVAALEEVAASPELAAAKDLADVRARALSLLGDALLQQGEHERAAVHVQEALRLAEDDGSDELRALWARVLDARREADAQRLRERSAANLHRISADSLRERFSGLQLADALVKKANAAVDHGEPDAAVPLAREALAIAVEGDSVREEVLARLSLVRSGVADAASQLETAWRRAERADQFNLVGAVARASEAHGIALPVQIGADRPGAGQAEGIADGDQSGTMS